MQRLYDILTSILGESKQGGYSNAITQYQFNCPFCADEKGGVDNKYNLEISFSLGKYHCWSCNSAGPISRLVRRRGGKELLNEYFNIINDIRNSKYYDLKLFQDSSEIINDNALILPDSFRRINVRYCRDNALVDFLKRRNITQDIIDYYNIGYTPWSDDDKAWRNRLILPSYDFNGELNYYIGRTYKDNDVRPKYKNCDFDKNRIILHEDKIQWDGDICLVEGALDCIYYPNSIAMLGKFLSGKMMLYHTLFERANGNVIICLDGDTTINETKKIYRLLDKGRLKGHIFYIRLGTDEIPYKDFGEIYEAEGRKGIIRTLRTRKQFNEIDLTF